MFIFVLCNYLRILAYFNKIWFLDVLLHQALYFSPFLRMLARGANDLKFASKKPLLAFGDEFL